MLGVNGRMEHQTGIPLMGRFDDPSPGYRHRTQECELGDPILPLGPKIRPLLNRRSRTGARHFFAWRLPTVSGRDKSGPYNSRNKLQERQFIARVVGAQFHCALWGGRGVAKK